MEYELCEYLGFDKPTEHTYKEWQKHFVTEGELEAPTKRSCTTTLEVQ